jgi:antitoxin VapB
MAKTPKSLYIGNEETCRLARELAALMGVTITEAVKVAVRERWERLTADPKSEAAARPQATGSNGSAIPPN